LFCPFNLKNSHGSLNPSAYQRSKAQNKQKMLTKIQNLMKTNIFLRKAAAMVAVVSLGFAFSCQDDEAPYATEAGYVAEESVTDYYYEDADDMSGEAVASEPGTAGGKVSSESGTLTVNDDRFCAAVTIAFDVASTLEHPIGTINIDFGAGCTDPRGNVRSGKIIIIFNGRRFLPGSSITIIFEDYVINGIKLSGTRTLTNITGSNEESPKFQIELEDGEIEWPDGTVALREHCYTRTWDRGVLIDPSDDVLVVSQCVGADVAATGVNRRGVAYSMVIESDLIYKRGCPIAVQGVKVFRFNGKEITVDGNVRDVNVRKRG
jgi:hypothetical protein